MSTLRLGRRTVALFLTLLAAAAVWSPMPGAATGAAGGPARPGTRPAGRPHAGPAPTSPRPVGADLRVAAPHGQRIDGFGVSGGWWPTALGRFPGPAQQELGELLFSASGLRVSQYRYNIGGGGVGVTDSYKAPPTFLGPSGSYDWNADPHGLGFLQMAAAFGVPQLIGFVNSAPPQFTSNAKSCGGVLRPDQVDAYAAYLAQVVAHLDTADHIRLSYVSPMNEPDTSQPTCRQEGMAVPVAERAAVVKAVARALAAGPAHTSVIADESSLVGQLLNEAPRWLPAARGAVAVVAHHTYDYPDPAMLSRVAELPGTHWATEICCYDGADFGWQYDPTMTSGLWLARTVFGDLGTAHDSAFDWWVAASPNVGCDPARVPGCQDRVNAAGRNDGLVYYDPNWQTDNNDTLYLTKRYWVLAAFSRYVRPGAVVHQIGGLPSDTQALAFDHGRYWSVVAANDSPTREVDAVIHLPPGASPTGVHAFVTDDRSNMGVASGTVTDGSVVVTLLPRSITSLVLSVRASSRSASRAPARQGRRT